LPKTGALGKSSTDLISLKLRFGKLLDSYSVDAFTLAGALDMPSVREMFDLARQYYAKSNHTLNPDVREALRSRGDEYMQKADELRRLEIVRGVLATDKKID
jgi:hypothetical protein